MIRFEHVTRRYGDRIAVCDLSMEIAAGEIVVLAGPSGCGKTTTLKMINRLIEPSEGSVYVDGRDTSRLDPTALRRSIGYVIQQEGLFPHRTIAENVATVPRLLGWDALRVRRRTEELLELVGLPASEYARRLPSQLSGGQRQRVGVARALGADPPVLLMDEPFGALDPLTRVRLQDELLRLQQVVHKTIVFVTHDIDEAIKLADRIAVFTEQGEVAQLATPRALLAEPATPFVDSFLGADRMLRRLGLIPLRGAGFAPVNGSLPAETVSAAGSLRDALDAVLRAADGRALVLEEGRPAGVIDAALIHAAAQ